MQCIGDSLSKGGEPVDESKSLASITVRVTARAMGSIFLVEAQPDPRYQPSELDDDIRTLETEECHDSGECQVRHRQVLHDTLRSSPGA